MYENVQNTQSNVVQHKLLENIDFQNHYDENTLQIMNNLQQRNSQSGIVRSQQSNSFEQFNRIQYHEEVFPNESEDQNSFDSNLSELSYNQQNIRDEIIENRVVSHTLNKSMKTYSKLVQSASHKLIMQQKIEITEQEQKQREVEKNLIQLFQLNEQQEVESEFLKDVEYNLIIKKYEKMYQRNKLTDPYYVRYKKLEGFARLKYELEKYNDNLQLLTLRKYIIKILYGIPILTRSIVNYFLFKICMTFLILFNVILYIIVKTNDRQDTFQIEEAVTICFITEILLRILSNGIFFNTYAFFRSFENLYDFILIFFTTMNLYYPDVFIIDISPLRLVTLLMYLKNIFSGLNVMMRALTQSIQYLIEALMIVILFSLIFASMGIFLFQNLFNFRCLYENDENDLSQWIQCHQDECYNGMKCMHVDDTIKMPTSFNNLIFSLGQILRTITMDDWSWVMFFTMRIFHPWIWIYYLLIILIGGFFGFNIVIAVLKVHYSEATEVHAREVEESLIQKRLKEEEEQPEKNLIEILDIAHLKEIGIYQTIKNYKKYLQEQSYKKYQIEQLNNNNKKSYQNEVRTLSAKQKQLESGIEKQTFINKISKYTLKNYLLPKIQLLDNLIKKIKIKNYTENELNIQVIERLKTISFARLQPQVNNDIKQEFNSANDILLKLIDQQEILKQVKKFNIQKMRQTKFKIIYHDLKLDKKKQKNLSKTQLNKSSFPTKFKNDNPLLSFYVKKQEKSNTESILNFQEAKTHQATDCKVTILETKYKTFMIHRNNEPFVYIQGYYINSELLSEKINQKIPKIIYPFVSNKFKYQVMRMKEYNNQKTIKKHNWSGKDVLSINKNRLIQSKFILMRLNYIDSIIWVAGIKGFYIMTQKYCYMIVSSKFSQLFFDLIILNNFTFLALQGIVDIDIISQVEDISTIFLCIELGMRLIGYKLKNLLKSPDLILQSCIVVLNLLEFTMDGYMSSIGQQNLRLIRGTKCLLFYRCLKYNEMAIKIGHIASLTFDQYIYLAFLMFLVIIMYALTGMEMFTGNFDQNDQLGQLHSYENIFKSFMTIFNIMTNDDWYGVYVLGSGINFTFSIIYSFSLVLILNYLTYGLVIAILLDGFGKYLNQPVDEIQNEVEKNVQEQLQHITQNSDELCLKYELTREEEILSNQQINEEQTKQKPNLLFNLLKALKQLNRQLLALNPQLYEGIKCETSLYLFDKNNIIRIILTHIATSQIFIYLMDCIMYLSVIAFILKTYNDYEIDSESYPDTIQFACNIIQLTDTCINIIAKGLFMDEGAYFVSIFQILDFIYQVSNIIAYGNNVDDYKPILVILLYLGYFRPMKLLYRISWLTDLREAVGRSLLDIFNVLITIVSVWIVFGVYGIILYEQQFGFCEDRMNFEVNKEQCIAEDKLWINYKHNFDNITIALPSLFVIASLDGWGEIYQIAENSQISSIGPQSFNSYVVTYIYFILFVFIGSMFFISLFTGVLYTNLKENQQKLKKTDETASQIEFKKISSILINDFPTFSSPPNSGIRKIASKITNNSKSQQIMFLLLWVDFIILLMFTSDMTEEFFRTINEVHNGLSVIYLIWVILLFLALGVGRYFDNNWRRFYFFLIIIAIIDFILDYSIDWVMIYYKSTPFDSGYQLMRIFFSFRSLRIILIFQGFINLQRLMNVIFFALPYLGKILLLLLITMLVFALFGCQLFGTIDAGQVLDDQLNFLNVASAMMTLFKCVSGDDWRTIMTDTQQYNPLCWEDPKYCGSFYAQYYFFLFMFFSTYVLLTLFLLSLVEQFESFFQVSNSLIQTYVENVDKIKTVWCKYSSDTQGQMMQYKYLCRFLLDIGKPLGGDEEENLWDVAKIASSFKIKCDHYGYIQYNQLIYELFRVGFHTEVFKEGTPDSIRLIKQYNKETQMRLLYYRKNKFTKRSSLSSSLQLKANFNILHDYLTVLILFKTWQSYSKLLIHRIAKKSSQYSDNEFSIDSEIIQHPQQNMHQIIQSDNFEQSAEEITINSQFSQQQQQKHFNTNESQSQANVEVPIFRDPQVFSTSNEVTKFILSNPPESHT